METWGEKYGIYPPAPEAWIRFDDKLPPDGSIWVRMRHWRDGLAVVMASIRGKVNLQPNIDCFKHDLWQPVVFVDQANRTEPEPAAPPTYPYRKGDWLVCEDAIIRVSLIQSVERHLDGEDGFVRIYAQNINNGENVGHYLNGNNYEAIISLLTQ